VHIAADDGRFIAPAPFSSEKLGRVTGKLVLSPTPFLWTVRDKRIFAGEGTGLRVWDRYYDGYEPKEDLYLWPSLTLSANQDFDVDALPLRPDGDRVVQARRNAHPWTVTDASAARRTTTVTGQDGKTYTFTDNRDFRNPGRFAHPVWLSEAARISEWQGAEEPVMLVHPDDWAWLSRPETTHAGAFGASTSDAGGPRRGSWQTKVRSRGGNDIEGHGRTSVVVWKFPADLDDVAGFVPITFPLPVGTYPLLRDDWCALPAGCTLPQPPRAATKYRIRLGRTYAHELDVVDGPRLAMVTSMFFFGDYWKQTAEERARVNRLVAELHAHFGLCCFACVGAHHAIVFRTHNEKPCTPQALAALLAGEPKVVEVLCAHASPGPGKDGVLSAEKIRAWATGYARHYGKKG
jgi:hypothetical protein